MRNTLYFLLAAVIISLAIWQSSAPVAAEQQLINPPTLQAQQVALDTNMGYASGEFQMSA